MAGCERRAMQQQHDTRLWYMISQHGVGEEILLSNYFSSNSKAIASTTNRARSLRRSDWRYAKRYGSGSKQPCHDRRKAWT